eukprot:1159184-Pelagomonas_calceolata.AAC.13
MGMEFTRKLGGRAGQGQVVRPDFCEVDVSLVAAQPDLIKFHLVEKVSTAANQPESRAVGQPPCNPCNPSRVTTTVSNKLLLLRSLAGAVI